jgi:hypothetical protein
MNSPTANSSDTPSRTLMEDLRVTAYCRVCSDCRKGGCKGTRARVLAVHKESVKSGFMRALRGSFLAFVQAHREQAHSYSWNAFPCRSEPARDSVKTGTTAPNWRINTGHPSANIPDTTAFNSLRLVSAHWHAHCTRPPRAFQTVQGANA